MSWYLRVLKNYAVFSGRARRKEYWFFTLVHLIFVIALSQIDHLVLETYGKELGIGFLGSIYGLGVFIPGLAVSVRRLHDIDRSGWWALLIPILIVGTFLWTSAMYDFLWAEDPWSFFFLISLVGGGGWWLLSLPITILFFTVTNLFFMLPMILDGEFLAPFLYYLLLIFGSVVNFGHEDWALSLPSVLMGVGGIILFLVFTVQRGQKGPNRFGPDPIDAA